MTDAKIDVRKVYNEVDEQVKVMITNYTKRCGVKHPDPIAVDLLSCAIAAVYEQALTGSKP